MLNALIVGGTGLISSGIVKHLLARGARVSMYNRGQRENTLPKGVRQILGDRNDAAALGRTFEAERFDAVFDMICFSPAQAEASVKAFAGRCEQFVFCSTVCTYGSKIASQVLIDETFLQEPISEYGQNKLLCEQIFMRAAERGEFKTTIVRPSHTYG